MRHVQMRFLPVFSAFLLLAACGTDSGSEGGENSGQADVAAGLDIGEDGGLVNDTGAGEACPTGTACDDGDPCTSGDKCINGACYPGPATQCDPSKDTDCTFQRCESDKGGCTAVARADGTVCDDGDPCTVSANCDKGACVGGKTTFCTCKKNEDCDALEDGNKCNGTLYCELNTFPWRCQVNKATVIDCAAKAGPCTLSACDGQTGECVVTDKADGTECDDGDICTKNEACAKGKCEHEVNVCTCKSTADCALLDDEDKCNGTLFCDLKHKEKDGTLAPKCKVNPASIVKCQTDKDTACAKAQCEPKLGKCILQPVDGGCDDDNKCTTGDVCILGKCIPGTNTCICKSDKDCAAKDDGDFCNGTMFCNQKNGECEVNPTTVISCPTVNDSACAANKCQHIYPGDDATKLPTGATCTMTPVADSLKKSCSDNDPCTTGDVCLGGSCKAGKFTCFCKSDNDCLPEDDGNFCNGVLFCNKAAGKCEFDPTSVVKCSAVDNTACAFRECQPKSGKCALVFATNGDNCEDGSVCTSGDYCFNGKCTPNKFTCQCKEDGDCLGSDDGNKCNGTFFCDKGGDKPVCKHNPASVVFCKKDEDTACVKNTCDAKTGACGLKPATDLAKCEDGNACTTSDYCKGGTCRSGTSVCECEKNADCAKKDDGNVCNGVPYCDTSIPGKFTCKPNTASTVDCIKTNDTQCTKNLCDPKTGNCGMTNVKKGVPCDDGDKCTASESCDGGSCKNGTFTCKCKTNADCINQDDGDLCNGVPYCDTSVPGKNVCKPNPNSKVFCAQNVNTQCLQNRCNAKDGKCSLQPFADGKTCDDGDACSLKDACKAGSCAPGGKRDCNDNDACTTDSCDKKEGCKHGKSNCADGNTCTEDKCDAKTGKCDFATKLKNGASCNADNSGCTVNDACLNGACQAGPEVICQLDLQKCQKALCQSNGINAFKCVSGALAKGASCDDGESCTVGAVCDSAGKCIAGKQSRLWVHNLKSADNHRLFGVYTNKNRNLVYGLREVLSGGKVSQTYLHATVVDEAGKPFWENKPYEIKALTSRDNLGFVSAHVTSTFDWMLVGTTTAKANSTIQSAVVSRVKWDGTEKSKFVHNPYTTTQVRDSTQLADGGLLITGIAGVNGNARVALLRTSNSGHLTWAKNGHINDDFGNAIVDLPGNESIVVGRTGKDGNGVYRGMMMRFDAKGDVSWRKQYVTGNNLKFALFTDVESRPSAAVTAVGTVRDDKGDHYWIVRADRTGKVQWTRKSAGFASVADLRYLQSGKLFLTGSAPGGSGGIDAWAMLTDPIGNPIWQKNFEDLDGLSGGNVQLVAGESHSTGFMVVGHRSAGPDAAFVTRISGWGHKSCEEGGECASTKFDACDDGQPCTLDTCNAKTGKCEHAAINGLVCDPQDGCTVYGVCTSNKCVADPNGKLWLRHQGWYSAGAGAASHYQYSGVGLLAPTADGGALVIGHRHKNQYPKYYHSGSFGYFRRVDHTGQPLWSTSVDSLDPNSFNGTNKWALERANGETWFGYQEQSSANGYGRKSWVRRFTAGGAKIAAYNWAVDLDSKQRGITAIAEGADGSSGYVIYNRFYRRNDKHAYVTDKAMPTQKGYKPSIRTVISLSQGRWAVAGIAHNRGYVALLAPDGSTQWVAAPDQLLGFDMRAIRVRSTGTLTVAGFSTASGSKRRFIVARLGDGKGSLKGVVEVSKQPANSAPFVAPGPDNGFAFAATSGAGTDHTITLFTSDEYGRWQYGRELTAGTIGKLYALAPAADDGILYGGNIIDSGGKLKAYVAKTGPWGFSPCPQAGKCQGITRGNCNDKDACTVDVCEASAGCVHKKASCNDGNACTTDSCDKVKGCLHTAITCDDGKNCTQNNCNVTGGGGVKAGCDYPLVAACNDGSACTTDGCGSDHKCTHKTVDCDDKNACTKDWCEKASGCKHSAITCNDYQPCTLDTCNKVTGCVFTKLSDGAVCQDNSVCKPLGKGICQNLKCTHNGKATKGCTSKTPAKTCQESKSDAATKLDNYVGWVWLDEDGDGKDPKREWCDMKAGAFKRLYINGVSRPKNSWGPGSSFKCTGGPVVGDLWAAPAINVKWDKGTKDVTVNGALEVPQAHTHVRVRFRYNVQTPNDTYKTWGKVQIHLSGKQVLNGTLGSLPKVWSGNPKKIGPCTNGWTHTIQSLQGDYSTAHTGSTVALAVRTYTTASTHFYTWPLSHVEVWVK